MMQVQMETRYDVVCRDAGGVIKWTATCWNTVVTAGLNKLLDACFKTGLASPAWYVGLKGAGTIAAGDTMASHAGWSELTDYDEAVRQTFTPGTISAGSVSNTASKAVITASGNMTVAGMFLANSSTKSESASTLYGAADFTEGNRVMVNNDTLTITVTLSAAAA